MLTNKSSRSRVLVHKPFCSISRYHWLLILLFFAFLNDPIWAIHDNSQKDFIVNHVNDAHEWHFATVGQTCITLPLPIILFSRERGLEIFSSSHLLQAYQKQIPYRGYQLSKENKIVTLNKGYTVYDISITKNVASMLISVLILLCIILVAAQHYKYDPDTPPRGFWAFLELIISFIKDEIAIPSIGQEKYGRFMPYLLTVFFFIWLNNLMGLLPGAANVTGNISVTLALALLTFLLTSISGSKLYWKHVFSIPGVPKWLAPIMIPVELIGLFTKPISLAFRLFANITAGHIILLSIISLIFTFQSKLAGLISVPFGTFMFLLKLLVAFIQAYIFTLLSAIYFGTAISKHEEQFV